MTTIAYKNGVMAGDTRVTRGGEIMNKNFNRLKVFKISAGKNRMIVGVAGPIEVTTGVVSAIENMSAPFDQIKTDAALQDLSEDVEALVYICHSSRKELWRIGKDGPSLLCSGAAANRGGVAIGTGRDWATGAMNIGGTAREGIIAASISDVYTNRDVRSVYA